MERSNDVAMQPQRFSSSLSVFCAAAPADEALLAQWETYLLPLQQKHPILCWSTRHIAAGMDVEQERSSHLDHADLILLLLSADFFASKECLAVMQRALQRQRAGSAHVLALLLRPVEWQETELAVLAPLPANGTPVSQWTSQDEAWHACVLGLQPIFRHRLSASFPAFQSVRAKLRAASDRERFLGRLRQTYHELLDRSLQGMAWMELGLASKPDAVRNASQLLLRLPQRDERVLAPETSILHAYEEAQEELLILGAPGAGKSTLLLDLAVQLVERAATDETHPLPVILPLSSWAVRRPPLASWLIEQLAHTYDVPQKLSERWVEQEHILPLLDGLDEMEETARSACIAAINTYHGAHLTPLVVCSRQSEYDVAATRERLVLQSAVVVQPLTAEHIETSLRTAGPAFSGLRAALDQQQAVWELATTPLMLSVLLLTYQGTSLEAVAQSGTDLEQRVWTDYVTRMVQQKGNATWYSLEQTHCWLAYLAQQMRVHQQTIFYAEYLQTDWLASTQQRTVTWLSIRVPALVLGTLACLLVSIFLLDALNLVSLLQIGLLGGFLGVCLSQNDGAGIADVGSRPPTSKRAALLSSVLLGVLVAASFGLSLGPNYFLGDWLRDGSILGLGSGLSAWIFQALLFRIPRQRASVLCKRPSLRWRVSAWFTTVAARRALQATIVFGAGMGLSLVLSFGLSLRLSFGLSYGLSTGLSAGLSYWLLLGLYEGMVQEHIEAQDRHQFNQGIRRSSRNGALLSLVSASIIAGTGVLSFGLSDGLNGLSDGLNGLSDGLRFGLSAGLSTGLSYAWILAASGAVLMWSMSGGLTILRHYVIRWLLARSRRFPWRAQAFLDDATARILLQRVGGGYRFMHRRLLDFFADAQSFPPEALAASVTTICNNCGSTLADDVDFCPKCGVPTPSYYSHSGSSQADPTARPSRTDAIYPKASTDYGSPPHGMLEKNPYDQSPYGVVPRQGRSSLVIGIISGTVVSILIFGVISTFALLTARGGSSSVSPTSSSPTPTSIAPGTILYQADWSQGMDGWPNTPGWSTLNGILINDGTGSAASWLPAAYQPSVSDYAVEAEMRIDKGCRSNGVIARAVGSNNYGAGAVCWSGIAQISEWSNKNVNTLGNKVFAPGNGWHKYRLELKGNILRLLIDGVPMIDVIDDTILTPGLVGLWSGEEQLEVRSFTVYSL